MRTRTIAIVGAAVVAVLGGSLSRPSESNDITKDVIYLGDVLNRRATLIGTIGKPIGEVATVAGHWELKQDFKLGDTDGYVRILVVTRVDGVALKTPARFQGHFVYAKDERDRELRPSAGEFWEMVAFEGIQTRFDQAISEAMHRGSSADPYGGLRNYLQGVVTKVVSGDKSQRPSQRPR